MLDLNITLVEKNQLRINRLIETLLHYGGTKIKHAVRSITQRMPLIDETPLSFPDIIFISTERADIDFEIELKKLKLRCPNKNIVHHSLNESGNILQLNNLQKTAASSQFFSPFQLLTAIAFLKTRDPSTNLHQSNLLDQESIIKVEKLSKGELEVASMIFEALTYPEIARRIEKLIIKFSSRVKRFFVKEAIQYDVQILKLYSLYFDNYQIKLSI